jgi:diadenosine tetraphosphatase ApaH/serine/threonine PP2A family protein phosphatase
LIVHAGILPQWDADQVIALAQEVEAELQGPNWREFLSGVFGNTAVRWRDDLIGIERHRVIVNALTRLRYCSAEGVMDLKTKEGLDSAPEGVMPWFDVPGRRTADDSGLRALVDAGVGDASQPDRTRYWLRLGRQVDRGSWPPGPNYGRSFRSTVRSTRIH